VSGYYGAFKAQLWGASEAPGHPAPDFEGGDIRFVMVDTADYVVNLSTHQDLADVPSGARVGGLQALANETVNMVGAEARFDADDHTIPSVTGDQSEALVLYNHNATEASALLIAYIDSFASGMPVTPNGGDIFVQWATLGIFAW
jgi:hypothetical protein